jgi:hypothetical protein
VTQSSPRLISSGLLPDWDHAVSGDDLWFWSSGKTRIQSDKVGGHLTIASGHGYGITNLQVVVLYITQRTFASGSLHIPI